MSKTGEVVITIMEKSKVVSNILASVFSDNLSFHISQAPEP